ncbi:MAG: hypothetical protein BA066_06880, partial [Candidatus Korarchaeota archaeon NZ13-K]
MEELRKAEEILEREVIPALWYSLKEDPKMASEMLGRMFREVIAAMITMDKSLSSRISELTENVNRLSQRIEEVNNQLSSRISELTENVNRLWRTVRT